MKINSENIDELMFQLLEGDIQGEERTRLLEAIEADKEYSALWQAWQQTILNPNDELIVMPIAPLLKKKKAVLWSWKYGVAAMLCISIGASVFYFNASTQEHFVESVSKPKNPKLEIIKVPNNEPVSNRVREKDTVISFKQKIESIAKNGSEAPPKKATPIPTIAPVQNIKEQLVEAVTPKPSEQAPKNIEPKISIPVTPNETHIVLASIEPTGVSMSVFTETEPQNTKPMLEQKIEEKRNLLSKIFSTPKLRVLSDTSKLTNRKFILENKAYKIIAGF